MRTFSIIELVICLACFTFCNARSLAESTIARDISIAGRQVASPVSPASAIIQGLVSQVQPLVGAMQTAANANNGSTTLIVQNIESITQSVQQATTQITQLGGNATVVISGGNSSSGGASLEASLSVLLGAFSIPAVSNLVPVDGQSLSPVSDISNADAPNPLELVTSVLELVTAIISLVSAASSLGKS